MPARTTSAPPSPRCQAGGKRVLLLVVVVALVAGSHGPLSRPAPEWTLFAAGAGLGADGSLVNLPPHGGGAALISGSRVVSSSAGAWRRAQDQRRWLASGTVPGASVPRLQPMVIDALLDIDTLTTADGATLASGTSSWQFVWPRDAAFTAAALAVSRHHDDAVRILEWLQDLPAPDGVFQARYRPDGSGPPDDRGVQTDGTGWILWATDLTLQQTSWEQRPMMLARLGSLIDRTRDAALRLTAGPEALPPPSQDYLEVSGSRLSLGTAAPLALGLESAAQLETARGQPASAAVLSTRALTLRNSITREFGADGYPRYLGGTAQDAALTFLLPPFTQQADPAVSAAWAEASQRMVRRSGGLAPTTAWPDDGMGWTPTTALAALAAAATGDRATAIAHLTWLDAHRTTLGALPEKVLSSGDPAGPAPLGWTAALVVLAAHQLDQDAAG